MDKQLGGYHLASRCHTQVSQRNGLNHLSRYLGKMLLSARVPLSNLQAVMCGVDEVAVKRIRADTPTASDLAVFTKEVAVLRCLHHRNIVQASGATESTADLCSFNTHHFR